MKPLASHEIIGNWATLLLPIAADDTIDYARLRDELHFLVNAGVDGLYTNGTAGEFYTLSESEFDRLHDMVATMCESARLPFQIGASHPCAQTSLERVKRAKTWAPSAIQVILPDWFPVIDAEAIAFLTRLAEVADPVGLVLYNPPHAKRVLAPEHFAALKAAVPGLVGIKTAGGDDDWYARMRATCAGLSIFIPGHHLASGLQRGAAGSYSNVACLHPIAAQKWYALARLDLPAALDFEQRLRRFFDDHIVPFITRDRYPNAAVDKLLAAIGNWTPLGTRLRWPYRWIEPSEAERLRELARGYVPEVWEQERFNG